MTSLPVNTLFLDIGGVLLTNGWDRHARNHAIETFHLNPEEIEERHHLTFDTYEEGKLTLDQYLDRIVFYEKRSFTKDDFKSFMLARSQPFPKMIQLIRDLKARYDLRTIAVSNEGRELTIYRIEKFRLNEIIDAFVSSSFVHFRKPDEDIFRVALDISQAPPQKVTYIDDRKMFVEIARTLGVHGIHHRGFDSTRTALEELGLSLKQQG